MAKNAVSEGNLIKIYSKLLERFGEQVKDEPATLGIADERDDVDGTFLESVYDGLEDDGGPKKVDETRRRRQSGSKR